MDCPDGFMEFVSATAPRLRRTAYLLCGDWHTAQDLTQDTLVRVFVGWRRIREPANVYAYAQRTLVNATSPAAARRAARRWCPARWQSRPARRTRIVCRTYRLPGGTKIEENLANVGVGLARPRYMLSVVILRPDGGVSATFAAMNYSVTGHVPRTLSAAPPVRMARLVAAAQDPRWGWTMNRGFVTQAEHLRLGGDSGRFWG